MKGNKNYFSILYFSLFTLILISVITYSHCENLRSEMITIAIIGSGIGGSSSAYYLLKNTTNIKVDMYERDDRIGGRIDSVVIANKTIDIGASFFIKENKLINRMIHELNVSYFEAFDDKDRDFNVGFFTNRTLHITLRQSGIINKIINVFKLFYNYGISPFYSKFILESYLTAWQRVYNFLDDNNSTFTCLHDMLETLKVNHLVNETSEEFFLKSKVGKKYIDEVFNGFLGNIYNQHKEINAFAGFVTLAGISKTAYKIKHGNDRLIEKIIKTLDRSYFQRFDLFLNTTVSEISELKNGKYEVKYTTGETKDYDYVIIACPVLKTGIKLNFKNKVKPSNLMPKEFQVNQKIYVKGKLNENYFGFSKESDLPEIIMFSNKSLSHNITEIALIKSDFNGSGYYVIQGDNYLTHPQLENLKLFKDGFDIVYRHSWDFGYPKLVPVKNEDMPEFVLSKNIYHLNAMETVASCMELSMISAKNVVKIILKSKNVEINSKNNTHIPRMNDL
jgi:prenylcysteine oxidase / farnesylcysteine lyase